MSPETAAVAPREPDTMPRGAAPLERLRTADDEIARPPSHGDLVLDGVFRTATWLLAWLSIAVVAGVVLRIGWTAAPAIRTWGTSFLVGTVWDANRSTFGILPAIVGTLYTSCLGLALGGFFGIAIAIFLAEGFVSRGLDAVLRRLARGDSSALAALPGHVEGALRLLVELLAAIPSVVYGLWGIFVVIPFVRGPADWLHAHLGWIPLFATPLSGPGILPASIVLAIMVLPTITAISRDALVAVPTRLREAAFGLGATRWEAILGVTVPTAATGICGAIILGFGRALGETMALAMLAGNANVLGWSVFSPGNTLAALLANHFPEAGTVEVGALMYAALVLLAMTLAVNVIGALVVQRATAAMRGIR